MTNQSEMCNDDQNLFSFKHIHKAISLGKVIHSLRIKIVTGNGIL